MLTLLWVGIGGLAGVAGSRCLVACAPGGTPAASFPRAALSMSGALVLGAAMHFVLAGGFAPQAVRIALATGAMGGFVTHATFHPGLRRHVQEAGWLKGGWILLAMSAGCLGAGMLGLLGARSLFPAAAAGAAQGRVRPPLAATFSIVARDPLTGELGVAVQSHWFSVGALVPWAEAGVGAVATQSFVEVSYGPEGLRLLREGRSPQEALKILTAADPQREVRQVGIIDARGAAASWTGRECISYAGHRAGKDYAVQGNLLAAPEVWERMGGAFEAAEGPLAERLLAALDAGQEAGGDARGMQSAALLVVGPGEKGKPWTQRKIDLRVEDHPAPLAEIRRVLQLRRAYDLANDGDRLVSEKKFEEAFKAYDKALALAPGNDELMFWRASMYMQAGRTEQALADVRRALAINPRWRKLLERLSPDLFPGAAEILKRLGS